MLSNKTMDGLQRKIRSISTIHGNYSVIKRFNYINSPAFCEPSICLNPELVNCFCIFKCKWWSVHKCLGTQVHTPLSAIRSSRGVSVIWPRAGRRNGLRFSRWNGRPRPLWHPEQPGHCTPPQPSPFAAPAPQSRSSSDSPQWMLEPRKRKEITKARIRLFSP